MFDTRDQVAELFGVLSSLSRTIRAQSTRIRQLGASGTSLGVLTALSRADARPGDLALQLHVGPSVVSRAIVPLLTAGLIERKPDPDDARACLLALTDLGRARLELVQDEFLARLAEIVSDWTDEEVSSTGRLLHRLDQGLTDYSPLDTHERLLAAPGSTDSTLTTTDHQLFEKAVS